MSEQIIINWTKTDDSETLIVNADIAGEKKTKVSKVDTDTLKNIVEELKKIISDLK